MHFAFWYSLFPRWCLLSFYRDCCETIHSLRVTCSFRPLTIMCVCVCVLLALRLFAAIRCTHHWNRCFLYGFLFWCKNTLFGVIRYGIVSGNHTHCTIHAYYPWVSNMKQNMHDGHKIRQCVKSKYSYIRDAENGFFLFALSNEHMQTNTLANAFISMHKLQISIQ